MLLGAIDKAVKMHKNVIEQLYTDLCYIEELQSAADPVTKRTSKQPVITKKDIPCKLVIGSSPILQSAEAATQVIRTIRIFLQPDITIKPGSRITVTQYGITDAYKGSSKAIVYPSHQEIELELFKEWA